MNDLKLLHDAWDAPAPPSRETYLAARSALLARARRRRRRVGIRFVAAATAGALAAAFVVVLQNVGDAPSGLPIASAQVLERAAATAERKPFTAPRPHEWIYTADRFVSSDGGRPVTHEMWRRADGGATAAIRGDSGLQVTRHERPRDPKRAGVVVGPLASYEAAAALPADPDALLRWAYREAENITGAGLTEHGDVYAILGGILGANPLPPKLEAALFRALKRVPGVTVTRTEVMGQPVLSLAQTEDWLTEEIFLDPETYTYRGQRGTVVRDAVISPEKAGNTTGAIEQGHTATTLRVRTAIVDDAGDRR